MEERRAEYEGREKKRIEGVKTHIKRENDAAEQRAMNERNIDEKRKHTLMRTSSVCRTVLEKRTDPPMLT